MAEDRDTYRPYFNALPVKSRSRKFAERFLRDTNLSSIAVSNRWINMRHQPLQIFLRKVFKDLELKEQSKAANTTHASGTIWREPQEIGTGFVHRKQIQSWHVFGTILARTISTSCNQLILNKFSYGAGRGGGTLAGVRNT
jgi:hypothetical protein